MCPDKDSQTVTPVQAPSLDFLGNLSSVVLLCMFVSQQVFSIFPASKSLNLQSSPMTLAKPLKLA